jgi:uncharacterized protein (TIGR02301 family)
MPVMTRSLAFRSCAAFVLAGLVLGGASMAAFAQAPTQDGKPYDDRLMRLSEILGAVHYLRELCGANDGMLWRDRMRELMDAEGSSALRRARLTRSFNNGYRSYSRTYASCTGPAQTAVTRFLTEGAELADAMLKSMP